MVKLMILFQQPPDESIFEQHYNEALALLEQMPGIQRRQANMVLGSPAGRSPYYRILEFYFHDFKALDEAMTSEAGRAAGQKLIGFAGELVELVFADVTEDGAP